MLGNVTRYLLFLMLLSQSALLYAGQDEATVVYLVRHAEKQAGRDPELTLAGRSRALDLAHVLSMEKISAIYASQYRRTQATGQPLADIMQLPLQTYDAGDSKALAKRILTEQKGHRVMVVGHSNTLDDIASALGVTELEDLDESMYDRLFVVHRFQDHAYLQVLRFGDVSP